MSKFEGRTSRFDWVGPTSSGDSPTRQKSQAPAFAGDLDNPEPRNRRAVGPVEDDCQGAYNELTGHTEIESIAQAYVGYANSHDQETD